MPTPEPLTERNYCPHCRTCGHWRADHRNLDNRPRPCHYDDGCRGFKENDEARCDACAAMKGQG